MRWLGFLQKMEFRVGAGSGALLALASPPSALGFLAWIALVPLLWFLFSPHRWRSRETIDLRTLILSFGVARHGLQLHWLVLLGDASPLTFKWALPLMLALLILYATLPDALVLWAATRIRERSGLQAIWWVPALWVLAEWLRGFGEMGFPWLGLASTQLRYLPMLQITGLLGELGLSLLVVWVNVLAALTIFGFRGDFPSLGRAILNRWWAPVALLILLTTTVVYGVHTVSALETPVESDQSLAVGLVQANVNLHDKWDPAKRDSTFVPYTRLTERVSAEGARLVVWAETALPMDLPRRPEYLEQVRDLVRSEGIGLLAGFVERAVGEEGQLDSYNSAFFMQDDGVIAARYRKMHLLPFGERMPFQDLIPALGGVDFGQAEWEPGREHTIFEIDGHRFAVSICFESIFSRLGRRPVNSGAGMLVNITNDGWFGRTVLPHQHAWLSVLRATENRVPLIRVANNGISFAVAPSGRILQRAGLFERDAFTVAVTPNPGGSFYTRHGNLTLWLLLAAGCLFLLLVELVARRDGR